MRDILLTGASGFLGKVIAQTLRSEGCQLIESGRNNSVKLELPYDVRALETVSCDVVVHAAGKAHSVPQTEEELKSFWDTNFIGTKRLCHALEKNAHPPKALVFISSVAVYGVDRGTAINENHPLQGQTPYAKSKIAAEQFLTTWCAANNITLSILRLPLIAGPHPPGNLGAMIKGMRTGRYLSIGDADAKKSIVWAADIAKIIPALSEIGGIYNLTDGYHPTFDELELGIAKVLGKKKPTKIPLWAAKCLALLGDIIGRKAPINSAKLCKMTSTLTFDDSKARRELNWNPTPVLEKIEGIV